MDVCEGYFLSYPSFSFVEFLVSGDFNYIKEIKAVDTGARAGDA